MKNHRFIFFILISLVMIGYSGDIVAQHNKKLHFRNDSTFKIVQFTDTHLKWQDNRSDTAYACIDHVIRAEKPDLIILTGDIIYSQPAIDNFKKIINYVASYKIPFGFVFGNHDHEQGVTDSVLLNCVKNVPYNLSTTAPGISGDCNFDLPIYSKDGKSIESVIYCIDSHDYSHFGKDGIKGYDYIHRDQIDWYVNTSKRYTEQNGNKPLPSIAFFHIPIPEYGEAIHNQDASLYGSRREGVASPILNRGLFTAIKEQQDIMGVFCGHDHDNDYAVNYYNVLLAYGRFSGGNTEYNHLRCNGSRVIELKEGQRTIHTWIRLSNGEVQENTVFPRDYVK
jgi:3',5'-cyclic AMP phosphodiesterase CpdA